MLQGAYISAGRGEEGGADMSGVPIEGLITAVPGPIGMPFDKDRVLGDLEESLREGEVDEEVRPLLDAINSREGCVTTSSCSGRIQLIQLPRLGDKRGAKVLGKWHSPVDAGGLGEALRGAEGSGMVFLMVQSPIVHVRCRDLRAAADLRALGEASGLKYSTIRSLTLGDDDTVDGIVVELLGTGSMDMPLGAGGWIFPEGEYLEFLVDVSNKVFSRNKERFDRLLEALTGR